MQVRNGSYPFHMTLLPPMNFHLLKFPWLPSVFCKRYGLYFNYHPPAILQFCKINIIDTVASFILILLCFVYVQTLALSSLSAIYGIIIYQNIISFMLNVESVRNQMQREVTRSNDHVTRST